MISFSRVIENSFIMWGGGQTVCIRAYVLVVSLRGKHGYFAEKVSEVLPFRLNLGNNVERDQTGVLAMARGSSLASRADLGS